MIDQILPDNSEIQGAVSSTTIPYDYLVMAVGAEVQTFNIPGVKEKACFMKELPDAEKVCFSPSSFENLSIIAHRCKGGFWTVRYAGFVTLQIFKRALGIESASFPGQSPEEVDRLLHMVVVGGGPTGIELRLVQRYFSLEMALMPLIQWRNSRFP
jgi:NADH:ubiquinone reductase (non-electrogenic)